MCLKLWAICTILLLAPALSFTDPSTLGSLELNIAFGNSAKVYGDFERVVIKTYEIPQNDERQSADCTVPTFVGTEGNRYTVFSLSKNEPVEFSYSCTVSLKPVGTRVTKHIAFPLATTPKEVAPYLAESRYVKINDPIAQKALELSRGKSDEFDVVSSVAHWVFKNIKYDFQYIATAEESTYVYQIRRGACDEFSHLMMAMLRSLGIPARYIGGYAYGGSAKSGSFGPHGWVEVYFPNSGWVPFDPTYGQFGWVDASHVKLYSSTDESFPVQETNYTYLNEPPEFVWALSDPSISTLSESSGFAPASLSFTMPQEVNRGEYFRATTVLENTAATAALVEARLYYRPSNLPDVKGLQLAYGSENSTILLFPGEPSTLDWVFLAPTPNYIFPVVAVSGYDSEQQRVKVLDAPPTASLSLSPEKNSYKTGEQAQVTAVLSSSAYSGPVTVTELNSGVSSTTTIDKGKLASLDFSVPARQKLDFYSTTGNYAQLALTISDSAISYSLSAPNAVTADEQFNVSITAASAEPVEAEVTFGGQAQKKLVSPSATFTFPTSLKASSIISAAVKTLKSTETLKKFIEVYPAAEISLSPTSSAFNEPTLFRLRPTISNGEIRSLATSFPWGNYSGADFEIAPKSCGIQYYTVSVVYADSLNNTLNRQFSNTINIDCNPISQLIAKILKALGMLNV